MSTETLPKFTEQYRNADRSGWDKGPWDDEPDKVVWTDQTTGLACLANRGPIGAWCGYVGLPASHPWHGKDYSEHVTGAECGEPYCGHAPASATDVHGGLTFADTCNDAAPDHTTAICHLADDGKPVWWFGFDCAHYRDRAPSGRLLYNQDAIYRDLPYVVAEVTSLASQLAAVES